MPFMSIRLSQEAKDCLTRNRVSVRALLEWFCTNYDEEFVVSEGLRTPGKRGRPAKKGAGAPETVNSKAAPPPKMAIPGPNVTRYVGSSPPPRRI